MITKWTLLCFLLLSFMAISQEVVPDCTRMNYLPMPADLTCGKENETLSDPCKLFFHVKIESKNNDHVVDLIAFQMKKSFNCKIPNFSLSPTLDANLIGFDNKVEV